MTDGQITQIQQLIDQMACNVKQKLDTVEATPDTAIDVLAKALNEFTRVMCGSVLKDYGLDYIDEETLLNLTVNRMYEHAKCCDDCFPPSYYKFIDMNRYIFDSCKDVSNLIVISYDDLYHIGVCAQWWLGHCEDDSYIDPYVFCRSLKILLYGYVDGLYLRDDISDKEKAKVRDQLQDMLYRCDYITISNTLDLLIKFYTEKIQAIVDKASSENPTGLNKYKLKLVELQQLNKDYERFILDRE